GRTWLGGDVAGVAVTTGPACAAELPCASRNCSTIGDGATPTVNDVGADGTNAICVAPPAVPVAVNVAVSDPDVAVRVFAPATGPSVHEPIVATPLALVVVVPAVTLPPPLATANTTGALGTGLFEP